MSQKHQNAHQQQHQQQQQHAIHVLFLEPSHRDPLMNRLTSALGHRVHGRGFCHVEICVPHFPSPFGPQQGFLSSSIYNGETVTATGVKTFANPGYAVLTEVVTRDQLQKIADGISEAARMRVGFDHVGMFMAALPVRIPLPTWGHPKTFCSRYVSELLQSAGVGGDAVAGLDPRITTPSKLHRALSRRDTPAEPRATDARGVGVIGTVPFKQAAMRGSTRILWAPAGGYREVARQDAL